VQTAQRSTDTGDLLGVIHVKHYTTGIRPDRNNRPTCTLGARWDENIEKSRTPELVQESFRAARPAGAPVEKPELCSGLRAYI
jgi:hypothetical protein